MVDVKITGITAYSIGNITSKVGNTWVIASAKMLIEGRKGTSAYNYNIIYTKVSNVVGLF